MAPRSTNLPMRKPAARKVDKRLIAAGVVVAVIAIALCVWFFWLKGYLDAKNASPVYVAPVSSITGVMSDTDPRYSGLVEPQKVTKVNKDESRTVSEVLVSEGDQVYIGDPLFSYDTGEIDLSIRQAELELEGISNQLTTLQEQKTQLEKEQKDASKDDQFKYTVEIQSVELQIKTQEYQRSVKQSELDKLRSSQENTQVFAEVEGTVQQVNLTPATDSQGNPLPFISILSSGEFRIKGTITELNTGAITEGQAVTVRSRVDPNARWRGTVESIEHEPVQDNNNMYYGPETGEKASKYNFYVVLESPEGLMLGQHVYIEPDSGASMTHKGMWLPAMYLVIDEEDSGSGFVWCRDEEEKLELRPVMLGQYDQGEGLYEILSGLSASDYIAMPAEDLVAGGPTTTDASAIVTPDMDGSDGTADMEPGMTDPGYDEGGVMTPEGGDGADTGDGYTEGGDDTYTDDSFTEGGESSPSDGADMIMPRSEDGAAGGEPVE